MPSTITWWLPMPTAQWPSTKMHLTGNFSRPSGESPWWLGCWSVSTPGKNLGPCLHGSQLPTWSTWLIMGLLGNTGWVFSSRTRGMPSTLIPTAPHFWSLSTNGCRVWATGTCGTVWECYRGHSQGPVDSTLSPSWPCAARVCHWGPLQMYSENTTWILQWGPDQMPSRMPYAHMLATALAAPIPLTPVLLFAQPIGGMETRQSTHSAEHHWCSWSKKA